MDWNTQLPTSIFFFREGVEKYALDNRDMQGHENWTWPALYASVVAMVGDDTHGYASSDGINSKGLVANVLYAKNTDYKINSKPGKCLSVLRWVQYVLDNFATSAEVADAFAKNDIQLLESQVPGSESSAQLHLSVSDIDGQTTIIEIYNGAYQIHYSDDYPKGTLKDKYPAKKYPVMTNEPNFNIQLQLNAYWLWQWSDYNNFPSHTIPGGPFASDRFERATYYYLHLDAPNSHEESIAQSKSVVANASVPLGMKGFKGFPNIAPTLWSVLSDHNQLKYYFYNVRTPNVVWVDMKQDISGGDVAKLDMVTLDTKGVFTNHKYEGCINKDMQATNNPFPK